MATLEIGHEYHELADGSAACVVRADGSIDSGTVKQFDKALTEALEGRRRAVLDLSRTSYINSSGMAALIKHHDALRAAGGALVLAAVPKKIEATFDTMGLLSTYDIEPTVEGALERLGRGGSTGPGAGSVFPLRLSCDSCVAGLVADSPGKYRCPRCQTCFEVSPEGEVNTFPARAAQSVEINLPCQPAYVDVARAAVASVAKSLEMASFSSEALDRAVDEAIGLYAGKAGDGERRIRMFVAGDSREFRIAFLSVDPSLALGKEDEEGLTFRSLKGIVDELEIQELSPNGQVLRLVKRFDY